MEHTVESLQFVPDSGAEVVGLAGAPRFCLLSIGSETLAVELNHMREVFRCESITPVPGMPPVLAGVANLRGSVIPLADVRSFLGVSSSSSAKYVAVVREGGRQIGMLIDEVPDIRTFQPGDVIEAVPGEMTHHRPFLSGLLRTDGGASGLVDVSKLLAFVEGLGPKGHESLISGGGDVTRQSP